MKRLTDEMKNEMITIAHRVDAFNAQFVVNVPTEECMLSRLNSMHGYELENHKVRLENFYSETDVKEQTFQDFQTYIWNPRVFSGDFYPLEYSRKRLSERKISSITNAGQDCIPADQPF